MAKFKKLDLGTQEQQMDAINPLLEIISQSTQLDHDKKQAALDFMATHQKKLLNKLVHGNVKTGHDLTEEERIKLVSVLTMVKDDNIPNNRYRFDQIKKRVTVASNKIQARNAAKQAVEATDIPESAVQDLENGIAAVVAQEFGPQKPAFLSGGTALIHMGPEARLLMPSGQPAQTSGSTSGKPLLLTNTDRVYSTQDGLKSTSSFFSVRKVAGIVLAAAIGLGLSMFGGIDKEQVQTSSFTPEVSETVMASVMDDGEVTQVQFAFVDNTEIPTSAPTVTDSAEPIMANVTPDDTPSEAVVAETTTVEAETMTAEPEAANSAFNDSAAAQQAEAEIVDIETASIEPLDTAEETATADAPVTETAEDVASITPTTEENVTAEATAETFEDTANVFATTETTQPDYVAEEITLTNAEGLVQSFFAAQGMEVPDSIQRNLDLMEGPEGDNYDANRVYEVMTELSDHFKGTQGAQAAFDFAVKGYHMLAEGNYGRVSVKLAANALDATEWLPKQFGLDEATTSQGGAVASSPRPMPAPRG